MLLYTYKYCEGQYVKTVQLTKVCILTETQGCTNEQCGQTVPSAGVADTRIVETLL